MLENLEIIHFIGGAGKLAQIAVPDATRPEDAALLFSGPRFFVALIAGVLLAFAIQFLLTNLSVAAGITYLGNKSSHDDSHPNSQSSSSGLGSTLKKVSTGVGLWTLLTVSLALFVACFLAVKLSLLFSPGLGAIVGLVIWAAYFTLLVWFSSTTVGSLLGSLVNTVTSGFQTIFNTATAAIGGKMVGDRTVATVEAAAAAVRRELGSAIDPVHLREKVEDYLDALRPPDLDLKKIRNEMEDILHSADLKSVAAVQDLGNRINRQTFEDLISSRTDLSKRDAKRLVDQLESTWNRAIGAAAGVASGQKNPYDDLRRFLSSALPEELQGQKLSSKLDQFIEAIRSNNPANQSSDERANEQVDQVQKAGLMSQAMQMGMSTIMAAVMGRKDLSDFDVERILGQLKQVRDQVGDKAGSVVEKVSGSPSVPPINTVRNDVENYLLHSYSWQMNNATVERDFREVLYDPDADPSLVRQQLESLNRQVFVDLLSQRGVFTQEKIAHLADLLDRIRVDVLSQVHQSELEDQRRTVRQRIEHQLRYAPKAELLSGNLSGIWLPLLQESHADPTILREELTRHDQAALQQLLSQRQNEPLSPEENYQVVGQLAGARDRALQELDVQQAAAESQLKALQTRVENYLQNTHKDALNPEGIKRDLELLRQDPQLGLVSLRTRFSQFDRDTLVKLLSQRQDLSEEQINHTLDQVESTWNSVVHTPGAIADTARTQYDQLTSRLSDYLRNTNREELNPEGIQRDLKLLLNDPQAGLSALGNRLTHVDRDTLVQLLSQRQDLSEEQVNQIIDQVQSTLRQVVRAPRRLASRTQQRVMSFESSLEDYLRHTNREELDPEGIKRDLYILLHDPRLGLESLGDRLSRVDRNTLVALLAQRQDMTEEEANRVVDQVLSVRDTMLAQVQRVQHQVQSLVEGIIARIRNFLNSLERPELNYEGIERDVRTLFSDPQAGFDALRDRLSHFNRDTLVAVLSSRDDISEQDVNRILDQVESARTGALRRAERIQQNAMVRVEELKRQAQKQAIETQKAAATAAWWLFGTALTSAIVSAVAGALAVTGG